MFLDNTHTHTYNYIGFETFSDVTVNDKKKVRNKNFLLINIKPNY
jgi:hypothetical protein